jgi:uncharacterized protein YbaP (TraB family)
MAGLGFSQEKKEPKSQSGQKVKKESASSAVNNTLLWQITGKGLKTPSYLFGTMHVLCADDAKLSEGLRNVIRDSKRIYFEIDMDNMQELMGALKYLRMNNGEKISDLLTKEEYDRVKTYFDNNKSQIPFSMMNRFKPYFVSSLIGEQLMTCEEKNGMESVIMKESKTYQLEIKGLETTEFQASIFDSIPYQKQAKDLVAYIDSIDHYRQMTTEMVDVYLKQDLNKLDVLMQESDIGMQQYMDLLLYGRNRRWVKQMPLIMAGGSTLFAVGAGHLPGKLGVISLLKKAGYKVTPLKN